MRIDDDQVYKVCMRLYADVDTMMRLAGFEQRHAPTSRQEGRRAITIAQARTIAEREWDNYPDKGVLVDELVDRGLAQLTAEQLVAEMIDKRKTGATATPGQHLCEPCNTSYPSHKHLLTHRAEDHAGGTDPYNITQEATT